MDGPLEDLKSSMQSNMEFPFCQRGYTYGSVAKGSLILLMAVGISLRAVDEMCRLCVSLRV